MRILWYTVCMKNTSKTPENIEDLKNRIVQLEILVKHYEHQLLSLKRKQFGTSSEKSGTDINQLNLFGNEAPVSPPDDIYEITYKRRKKAGKREEDLSGLPVERIDYELSESERACPECGETMRDTGVLIRKELKLIPAKVVVMEHAAHSYACRNCEQNNIKVPFVKAESPKALISGSLASPSLVAHIAVQKYANGMPLYRLEKGFRYEGANISRQNMANWVIACSERYLECIYELLKRHLLDETVLHADETTVQVLREPGRKPQSKSYEWIYRTGTGAKRKITVYDYKETRSQEHPKTFLNGFKGLLHTDGYQVYHNLPAEITVVGCWAHVRRKFEAVVKTIPEQKRKTSDAACGMAYINALFSFERSFENLTPGERHQKRLEQSKPVSDAFFAWAKNLGSLPKTPLGEASGYALSQRKFLENVFINGRADISNNRAERAVKPFVMGRKAWLFSCTPAGAKASSVMYSIIETAKDNGLHPYCYMEYLLEKLPGVKTSEIESLLPWCKTLPQSCYAPIKLKEKKNG